MSIGKKILHLRLRSRMTQKEISDVTGLAVSYLSRLENNRVVPSIRTLGKIANGFGVPLAAFFESESTLELGDKCPISLSGRCILDHAFLKKGRRPKIAVESYSTRQLEILRLCNYLLHSGNPEILTTLSTMMKSLAEIARGGKTG